MANQRIEKGDEFSCGCSRVAVMNVFSGGWANSTLVEWIRTGDGVVDDPDAEQYGVSYLSDFEQLTGQWRRIDA